MRVSFAECGVKVAAFSLKGNMEMQRVRSVSHIKEVEMGRGGGIHTCVVLPLGAEDGEIPSDRLSRIIA